MKTLKSKIIALAVCSALTASAFAATFNSSDDATKATLSVSITAIKPHKDSSGSGSAAPAPAPQITTKKTTGHGIKYTKQNYCTSGKNGGCFSKDVANYAKCEKTESFSGSTKLGESYKRTTSWVVSGQWGGSGASGGSFRTGDTSNKVGSNFAQCNTL